MTLWTVAHQATLSVEFLAKMLEWVAILIFRGLSRPRDRTWVSCIAGDSLLPEPEGQPKDNYSQSIRRTKCQLPFVLRMDGLCQAEGSAYVGSTACRRVAHSDFRAGVYVTM